ncbi:hypothetical protein [Streptomyces sp. MST-110588]|uniref:DUF6895 family protein n=1 Tax=Streptomyces sp. MST-110588 TaxID=2833628 RepID=UPI001F5DB807|nr:hypothetical protein [Streptomyces sp. MST-110588]
MYAAFAEAGLRHDRFETFLRATVTTRAWRLTEREPTRTLAVLLAERRLALPPHCDREAAQARTWLGGLAEPWAFTTSAGYAATHHVFHLTNWGAEPRALAAAVRDHLALWLPAWLDCTVAAGHWDLTGELLAVAAMLPVPPASPAPYVLPGVAQAWRALAAAQRPDGAVPEVAEIKGTVDSPETVYVPETVDAPEPDEAEHTFRTCYHSTLVTAFAATLAAHMARRTSDDDPVPPRPRARARHRRHPHPHLRHPRPTSARTPPGKDRDDHSPTAAPGRCRCAELAGGPPRALPSAPEPGHPGPSGQGTPQARR